MRLFGIHLSQDVTHTLSTSSLTSLHPLAFGSRAWTGRTSGCSDKRLPSLTAALNELQVHSTASVLLLIDNDGPTVSVKVYKSAKTDAAPRDIAYFFL